MHIQHSPLLVSEHSSVAVFLIVVLQELTQLPEIAIAFIATVGIVGRAIVVSTVGQHGPVIQVRPHGRFGLSESVNAVASILLATTSTAVATFYMLHGIGSRSKALLSTNRTRHIARTMDLHVHVQIVLIVKGLVTLATLVLILLLLISTATTSSSTVWATREAVTLAPLIVAVVVSIVPVVAACAVAAHLDNQNEATQQGLLKWSCDAGFR